MRRPGFGRRTIAGAILVLLGGCATVEFSRPPDTPDLRVLPGATEETQASPPALPPAFHAPVPAPETVPAAGVLKLTIEQAIRTALENNQALKVEQIDPASAQTLIAEQRALFDPELFGTIARSRQKTESELNIPVPVTVPGDADGANVTVGTVRTRVDKGTRTDTASGTIGINQFFPTGASVSATVTPSTTDVDHFASRFLYDTGVDTESHGTTAQLSVNQPLLRGAGLKVNLADLRQARLAALSSDYELRGFVENLVAQIESTYWDYSLAKQQIRILEKSLALAEDQAAEVEERIRVGVLPETERAAAAAEVAQRRSSLIDGHSSLDQLRLALLRLLNPTAESLRTQEVELTSKPAMPDIALDKIEESIAMAYQMRPELNQTRLLIQEDDLELVKTRNGLLPRLDLFMDLSKDVNRTEYGELFQSGTRDLEDDTYRIDVGAQFSYPLGNRAARARLHRAQFAREKNQEALANLKQLVEQDVRGAYVELARAKEQVAATAATSRLQEVVAQTEREKFRVGNSTALLVSQAQRDQLSAQINEVQAVKNFLKAVVNLYKLDGSLLLRRGIECPGVTPVEMDD